MNSQTHLYESRGLPVLSSDLIGESATSTIWTPWCSRQLFCFVSGDPEFRFWFRDQPQWKFVFFSCCWRNNFVHKCHMTAPLWHVSIFQWHYSLQFISGSLQERHISYVIGTKHLFFSCITHSRLIVLNCNTDKVRHMSRKYFWTEKISYNTVVCTGWKVTVW